MGIGMIVGIMIISILWFICAGCCLFSWRKTEARGRGTLLTLMLFFGAFGVVGVLGAAFSHEMLSITCLLVPVSVLCIGCFFAVVLRVVQCDTVVPAVCVSYNAYSGGKGQHAYAPVFAYTFEGQAYEAQQPVSYSHKKVQKKFEIGATYDVFIRANYPSKCLGEKKVPLSYYCIALFGVLMLVFYGMGLLQYLQNPGQSFL